MTSSQAIRIPYFLQIASMRGPGGRGPHPRGRARERRPLHRRAGALHRLADEEGDVLGPDLEDAVLDRLGRASRRSAESMEFLWPATRSSAASAGWGPGLASSI